MGQLLAGLSVLRIVWQIGVAIMGRPAVITKPSKTCELRFYGFYRPPLSWCVSVRIAPPNGIVIKNTERRQYKFVCKLTRQGLGSVLFESDFNEGHKEYRHPSPVELSNEPIVGGWISSHQDDWEVEVWVVIDASRKKTLYKGHPTGAITIQKDRIGGGT